MINQEVSIPHTGHFLTKIYWVPFKIVADLLLTILSGLLCVDKEALVNRRNVNLNQVVDVFDLTQLFSVFLVASLVL